MDPHTIIRVCVIVSVLLFAAVIWRLEVIRKAHRQARHRHFGGL